MSKPTPATIIALVALFAALGGVGLAATGDNLILGTSNSADAKTALTAGVDARAVAITNLNTGANATALGLNVAANHPPLAVNSTTKVDRLNADQLDGLDSTKYVQGVRTTTRPRPPRSPLAPARSRF
jgi:hypothetical protein